MLFLVALFLDRRFGGRAERLQGGETAIDRFGIAFFIGVGQRLFRGGERLFECLAFDIGGLLRRPPLFRNFRFSAIGNFL